MNVTAREKRLRDVLVATDRRMLAAERIAKHARLIAFATFLLGVCVGAIGLALIGWPVLVFAAGAAWVFV